ncbi:VWA domain-containing protein, partial [Crossiella equi]
ARTALAHAAWRGAEAVEAADVEVAARLALPHRKRRDPFDEPGLEEQQLQDALAKAAEEAERPEEPEPDPDGPGGQDPGAEQDGPAGEQTEGERSPEESPDPRAQHPVGQDTAGPDADQQQSAQEPVAQDQTAPEPSDADRSETGQPRGPRRDGAEQAPAAPAPAFRARLLQVPGMGEGAPGRRSRSRSESGRVVRASPGQGHGLHLAATVTAAAPHQSARGRTGPGLLLRAEDVRRALREGKEGNLVLFAVDASGSMAARRRMSAVSGAVLSLLRDAYQRRDKVGLITFRGAGAELTLPPTSSVDAAAARLKRLRTGGRTPLADGLLRARRTLATERLRDPRRRPLLVVVTDGRATVGVSGDPVRDAVRAALLLAADGVASIVVDCESGLVRLGLAPRLALALGGSCLSLDELSADRVAGVVRAARAA